MNMRTAAILAATHGICIALGWWWVGPRGGAAPAAPPPSPAPTAVRKPQRPPTLPEGNPMFRAASADYRAAWNLMLEGRGDPSETEEPNGMFFTDWCRTDPEGAILGLREFYSPRYARQLLSEASNDCGAEIAEALTRHWEKLRFIDSMALSGALARCMHGVSEDDPARAVQLAAQLPPGIRNDIYWQWFGSLPAETLKSLAENIESELLPATTAAERQNLWNMMAVSVDSADPARGVFDWMRWVPGREAVAEFVHLSINHAESNAKWPEFLDALDRLDGDRRRWARQAVLETLPLIQDAEQRENLLRFASEM